MDKIVRAALGVGVVALGFAASAPSAAQTVTVLQDLDFGQLLSRDNTPGVLTLSPTGSVTASPNVVRVIDGSPAEFLVEGLQSNQSITVNVTGPDKLGGPSQGVNRLRWSAPVVNPATPVADQFGRARFFVGATLHTTSDTPSGMLETNFQTIYVTVTPIP